MNSQSIKVVEQSENAKTGKVSVTYASQSTCPNSCPLRGEGCYAEGGFVGFQTRRLNRSQGESGESIEELAMAEALAIAGLTGKLPLRLHVVGDATTDGAAKLLSDAATYHTNKYGEPVWTYTHAWRDVARRSWQGVNVFASCESVEDAKLAMQQGYAAAVVVDSHHGQDHAHLAGGVRLVPCPQQTGRAASCVECGLCMRAGDLLKMRSVIAFEAHGQQVGKVREQLVQIGGQA